MPVDRDPDHKPWDTSWGNGTDDWVPPNSLRERAISRGPHHGLGEPERWGGTTTLDISTTATNLPQDIMSPQLVRAQAGDLLARQWLFIVSYSLAAVRANFSLISINAEVTMGVGQSSITGEQLVFPGPMPGPGHWLNTATSGVVRLDDLGASAIAVRFHLKVKSTDANPATAKITLSASVSPRAVS